MYLPRTPLLALLGVLLAGCQDSGDSAAATTAAQATETAPAETAEESELPAFMTQATFPAQQRAPEDPALVAQGESIYSVNCRACHGQDLRGGDLGGPNLLRSQIVLADEEGEAIGAVVREGRSPPGLTPMPALPLSDADVRAVSAYIHSVVATARPQGAPPPGSEAELNIVVGSASAGAENFQRYCSECHQADGDLAGLASRIPDPETLQNSWVSGRHWGQPVDPADPASSIKVRLTLKSGETLSGRLLRRDDFFLSMRTEAGAYRSFSLQGPGSPVESLLITDPLARHLELMGILTDGQMHDLTAYLVTLK